MAIRSWPWLISVFFKGFVFGKGDVFQPIDDWGPKTTMTTKADTTMRTKAEVNFDSTNLIDYVCVWVVLIELTGLKLTETTTLMTTITTTTTTTTTTEATTTPDRDVVTFDPQQPPTTICNCNNNNNVPRLVKPNDEKISTQHSSARSAPATTQPTHIKIEVKNVISIIDLILSYLNVTRSNPWIQSNSFFNKEWFLNVNRVCRVYGIWSWISRKRLRQSNRMFFRTKSTSDTFIYCEALLVYGCLWTL